MWYAILIILLLFAVGLCWYLGKKLDRVRRDRNRANNKTWELALKNEGLEAQVRNLKLDLDMERSLSSVTRQELEAAFHNLEMVLESENTPVGNSRETFRTPNPNIIGRNKKGYW